MAHDPRALLEDIRQAASLILKFSTDRTEDDIFR